ncbi:hypothetical protein PN499_03125 [Kamptonema animale CS-326]|nr:hypothetical protein [Kamptonema animale]MDB9510201.1 hypothetical protein [Kamptonema animale CS-326]
MVNLLDIFRLGKAGAIAQSLTALQISLAATPTLWLLLITGLTHSQR